MLAFMTASPSLKGKARQFGRNYVRFALVEIEGNTRPSMISARAKGVVRIVEETTMYVGNTNRSEGRRLYDEMKSRAEIVFD